MMKPWLVAHRGALKEAQENTLNAFKACSKYPIAFIELDIRVTADNVAVIHHNPDVNGVAINSTKYKDLLVLDPNLASFNEVVKETAGTPLFVELKSAGSAIYAIEYLANNPRSQATSFILEELLILQKAGIPNNRLFYAQYNPVGHFKKAIEHGFGGITFPKRNYHLMFWRKPIKNNLKVMVYTVNSRFFANIIRSLSPKAYICTNRPDLLQSLK